MTAVPRGYRAEYTIPVAHALAYEALAQATECTHAPAGVCWLCSDRVPWWRAARIKAGYGEEPPNQVARIIHDIYRVAILARADHHAIAYRTDGYDYDHEPWPPEGNR